QLPEKELESASNKLQGEVIQLQKLPEKKPVLRENVDAIANMASDGRFSEEERRQVADLFADMAKNFGRPGEEALLAKVNSAMYFSGDSNAPLYQLRFGENMIKTPGGRRLEVVGPDGQVTDTFDFVVPWHPNKKAS